MRKAAGCVLLAILCLLGASYLPRILQEAQTDREQQNLISGYIQNPDTTDEENTESTTDEPEEETDPNMERIVDFQNLQQINPEILAWITVPGTPIDYPVALGMTVMFLHWDIKVTARNGNNGLQKPYRMRNMTVILPRPERRKFLLYPPA